MSGHFGRSQGVYDEGLNHDFAAKVKSVDEFIARFNGIESNPMLSDTLDRHRRNLLALMDHQMFQNNLSNDEFNMYINQFITTVMKSSVELSIDDSLLVVIAIAKVSVNKQPFQLKWLMRREQERGQKRWVLLNVQGMKFNKLIDDRLRVLISPVEHEGHFVTLNEVFNLNRNAIYGVRGKDVEIDEITAMLQMIVDGKMSIEGIEQLVFYCLAVPNYVFTVEEFNRKGLNTGWLISKIEQVKDTIKHQYIMNKLNNN